MIPRQRRAGPSPDRNHHHRPLLAVGDQVIRRYDPAAPAIFHPSHLRNDFAGAVVAISAVQHGAGGDYVSVRLDTGQVRDVAPGPLARACRRGPRRSAQ